MAPADRQGRGVRRQPRHRAQRRDPRLRDGSDYRLANVFKLSYPYGWPTVVLGLRVQQQRRGRAAAGQRQGERRRVRAGHVPCAHRWNETAHMVGFRNAVGTAALGGTSGPTAAARWRTAAGDRGYVAINRNGSALQRTFQTSLPAGRYCDVISGATTSGGCSGTTVTVASGGSASFTVPANGAVAVHVGQRAGGTSTLRPRRADGSQVSFRRERDDVVGPERLRGGRPRRAGRLEPGERRWRSRRPATRSGGRPSRSPPAPSCSTSTLRKDSTAR